MTITRVIQIDLNRIDPARIDTRLRRNGDEARFYSFILVDNGKVDDCGNSGECFEKLTKVEYAKGHRGRCVAYSQPLNYEIRRYNDQDDDSSVQTAEENQ